jgi:malate dehydrogenase (oxaloacetate-decarboxylating)(NADP+)
MLEETTETPILIGRPEVIERRAERAGLTIRPSVDFELVNPENDPRYRDYWGTYHSVMERRGVTPDLARAIMRTNTTAIGAVMVYRDEADSMICGTFGQYLWHLNYVRQLLGTRKASSNRRAQPDDPGGRSALHRRHPCPRPARPEQIAETVIATARHVKRFGVEPNIALCSGSQFGNLDSDSGRRMRAALEILEMQECGFAYEGEMHVDSALDPELRARIFPNSRLQGAANALVFASIPMRPGPRATS